MTGLGTLVNALGIVIGGIFGLLFGRLLGDRHRDTLNGACAVCVLFIGIAGAMEGLLSISDGKLASGRSMFVIACLAPGALVGEWVNLEDRFTAFGEWLKRKTGNARDARFVEAFVTASLTVCIGAMAIVGAIQDALLHDISVLSVKAVLDLIIIMVMTCSMGKGAIFSCIPVAIFQGGVTLLAGLLRPVMTDAALANLSLIGSILIFCVGVNLLWGHKVRVANLLPTLIFAVGAAFLPF